MRALNLEELDARTVGDPQHSHRDEAAVCGKVELSLDERPLHRRLTALQVVVDRLRAQRCLEEA